MHDLVVRLSAGLMKIASRLMPRDEAPWLEAMDAELHHIDGAGEKLMFAGGCVTASIGRAISDGAAEHAIRMMLIPALAVWAGGKAYLWLALPSERLVPLASEMVVLSALAYGSAAMSLLNRNAMAALVTLSVPLTANMLHFGMIAQTGYLEDVALISLAIVAEDFAIWIAATLGLATILILPRIRTERYS